MRAKEQEIRLENQMEIDQAIGYLEELVKSLRARRIAMTHGEESVTLTPPDDVKFKMKASGKGSKESVALKISWKIAAPAVERNGEAEAPDLTITSTAGSA